MKQIIQQLKVLFSFHQLFVRLCHCPYHIVFGYFIGVFLLSLGRTLELVLCCMSPCDRVATEGTLVLMLILIFNHFCGCCGEMTIVMSLKFALYFCMYYHKQLLAHGCNFRHMQFVYPLVSMCTDNYVWLLSSLSTHRCLAMQVNVNLSLITITYIYSSIHRKGQKNQKRDAVSRISFRNSIE